MVLCRKLYYHSDGIAYEDAGSANGGIDRTSEAEQEEAADVDADAFEDLLPPRYYAFFVFL